MLTAPLSVSLDVLDTSIYVLHALLSHASDNNSPEWFLAAHGKGSIDDVPLISLSRVIFVNGALGTNKCKE